ncbi:hypothetical protein P4C99_00420 [Pontiellaceae bacterium B1224]|nr:hypothetical protein [Pontiellaceae bacterium B1224]
MKRIILGLIAMSAAVVFAQDEVTQSGTPAVLEAVNGKKIKVFLQSMEGENLTFQPFKSTKNITVPASKINSLEFFPKYDVEGVNTAFVQGDFPNVIEVLEPVMSELVDYMPIENNMREPFVMLYNCYRFNGDYEKAEDYATRFLTCGDEELEMKGKAGLALVAIQKEDFETAEKYQQELAEQSEAAGLYLKAAIERAKEEPKQAMQTVTVIIKDHSNDQEWLPASELLAAYCYLDMTGTNSVITTNSAMNTARQVKNMYAGSAVAADAEKLWVSLGGPEIEALAEAERAERAAALKAEKERIAAEEKAEKEAAAAEKAAEKAAAEAAKAAKAAAASGVSTTETESE